MLPGPDYIYRCTNCSQLISRGSLASGNTFGATFYSDGKMIAPMLPDFPEITKCPGCETIFWLEKTELIEEMDPWESENPEWDRAEPARFLTIKDYCTALEKGLYDSVEEELYLRKKMWWAYNDRIRRYKSLFASQKDEPGWKNNILRLIELLNPENQDEKIMTAELYRNLGEFQKCMEILYSISDPEMDWLIEAFKIKCEGKNTKVFQLSGEE